MVLPADGVCGCCCAWALFLSLVLSLNIPFFAGPAAVATSHANAMIPNGTHAETADVPQPQPEAERPPMLPGQIDSYPTGPQIAAHQVHASPFQAVSMDRKDSWDEPRASRANIALDSMGNQQAPGANRQFSLELTTYASIPVRSSKSGFRPPHRSDPVRTACVIRPSLSCVKVISLAQRLTSADKSANQICLMHMWDACLHVTAEVCHQEQ